MQFRLCIVSACCSHQRGLNAFFPHHLTNSQYATSPCPARELPQYTAAPIICSLRVPRPARCPTSAILPLFSRNLLTPPEAGGSPFSNRHMSMPPTSPLFFTPYRAPFLFPSWIFLLYILLLPLLPVTPYPSSKNRYILSCPPEHYLHEMRCDGV